jgi:serine/threonine-protein kinase OSR1/STK39
MAITLATVNWVDVRLTGVVCLTSHTMFQDEYKKGISSWNFDVAALKAQAAMEPDEDMLPTIAEADEARMAEGEDPAGSGGGAVGGGGGGEGTLSGLVAAQAAAFVSAQQQASGGDGAPSPSPSPPPPSLFHALQEMAGQGDKAALPPPTPTFLHSQQSQQQQPQQQPTSPVPSAVGPSSATNSAFGEQLWLMTLFIVYGMWTASFQSSFHMRAA